MSLYHRPQLPWNVEPRDVKAQPTVKPCGLVDIRRMGDHRVISEIRKLCHIRSETIGLSDGLPLYHKPDKFRTEGCIDYNAPSVIWGEVLS